MTMSAISSFPLPTADVTNQSCHSLSLILERASESFSIEYSQAIAINRLELTLKIQPIHRFKYINTLRVQFDLFVEVFREPPCLAFLLLPEPFEGKVGDALAGAAFFQVMSCSLSALRLRWPCSRGPSLSLPSHYSHCPVAPLSHLVIPYLLPSLISNLASSRTPTPKSDQIQW